ncbi:MAG: beta-phosphoglucomutase, partial [Paludibacter sp.]
FVIAVNTGPLDEKVLWDSGADIVLSGMQELYEKWNF